MWWCRHEHKEEWSRVVLSASFSFLPTTQIVKFFSAMNQPPHFSLALDLCACNILLFSDQWLYVPGAPNFDSSNCLLILIVRVLAKVLGACFMLSSWPCIHLCRRGVGICKPLCPYHDEHQHKQQGWGVENTTSDMFCGWAMENFCNVFDKLSCCPSNVFSLFKSALKDSTVSNAIPSLKKADLTGGSESTAYVHTVDQWVCTLYTGWLKVQGSKVEPMTVAVKVFCLHVQGDGTPDGRCKLWSCL